MIGQGAGAPNPEHSVLVPALSPFLPPQVTMSSSIAAHYLLPKAIKASTRTMKLRQSLLIFSVLLLAPSAALVAADTAKPLKVFILAGQ